MIDFDELRKEVAIKHGVLLATNDPILVTVTLHELVLARYVEILAEQNQASQRAVAAALAEHLAQSKEAGGRVITDATNFVGDRARSSIEAVLAEHGSIIRQQLADAQTAASTARQAATIIGNTRTASVVAAICSVAAAVVAVAALIVFLLK